MAIAIGVSFGIGFMLGALTLWLVLRAAFRPLHNGPWRGES